MKNKYKDKCDCCNQYKICRGYKDKVLCEDCINKTDKLKDKKEIINNEPYIIKGQTTIFDYI